MSGQVFLECPECQSLDIWKYGSDFINGKKKQKYKCKKCGYVWREK